MSIFIALIFVYIAFNEIHWKYHHEDRSINFFHQNEWRKSQEKINKELLNLIQSKNNQFL